MASHGQKTGEHSQHRPCGPVYNSEVYLLKKQAPFPTIPLPSPPLNHPVTPPENEFCPPIEALTLSEPAITVFDDRPALKDRLAQCVHVLSTEKRALKNLTHMYGNDCAARVGFDKAVDAITRRHGKSGNNGKVVFIGVGKSGHIAKKLVATFNSLSIRSVFLHPTEAMHGDMGQIDNCRDTLLLITFSGKTPELLALLPHLDSSLPLILLTNHVKREKCEIVRRRPDTILLPATVHEEEEVSFGVKAPTTSTTVALAVGDALAITVSKELHANVASVFARNHPGGAIGAALGGPIKEVRYLAHIVVRLDEMASIDQNPFTLTGADILKAGYASPSRWVRLKQVVSPGGHGGGVVSPRQILRLSTDDLTRTVAELPWLVTQEVDFVPLMAEMPLSKATQYIESLMGLTSPSLIAKGSPAVSSTCQGHVRCVEGDISCSEDSVIAVKNQHGVCIGLVEVATLLENA